MLPEQAFLAWGWRIPFLLSVALIGIGLYIRLAIAESPAFRRVQETNTEARMPIVDVFRTHLREVVIAMGLRVAENGAFYVFSVFVLACGTETLGLSRTAILTATLVAAAVELFAVPLYGAISDRVGRRPIYLFGAVFTLLFAFPFFWLMNTENVGLIVLAVVLAVGHAAMYGPQGAFFAELFGTRVRYSGASTGYQLASIFAGALSPLIAVALLAAFGWPAVAIQLAVMALMTIVAAVLAQETHLDDIEAEHGAGRQLIEESGGSLGHDGAAGPGVQ